MTYHEIPDNDFQELLELLKNLRGLCTPDEIEFIDEFIMYHDI